MSHNGFESFFQERERGNRTLSYTGTRITIAEPLKKVSANYPNVVQNVLNLLKIEIKILP